MIVEDSRQEIERRRKVATRTFWFFWVPATAFVAGVIAAMFDSPQMFLPVWGILAVAVVCQGD